MVTSFKSIDDMSDLQITIKLGNGAEVLFYYDKGITNAKDGYWVKALVSVQTATLDYIDLKLALIRLEGIKVADPEQETFDGKRLYIPCEICFENGKQRVSQQNIFKTRLQKKIREINLKVGQSVAKEFRAHVA